jgi:hypothetical protein
MAKGTRKKHLWDAYRFPGFTPSRTLDGVFGDRMARVIRLTRRSKKLPAVHAARFDAVGTIKGRALFGTYPVATTGSTWRWRSDASIVGSAAV